jgi:hypothetical protein
MPKRKEKKRKEKNRKFLKRGELVSSTNGYEAAIPTA